jgi:O-antigen/teichoic acid export membrane protein
MEDKNYIHRLNVITKAQKWIDTDFFIEVICRSAKVVIINIIGAFLLFLSNYLLVKFLGEKSYGSYVIINIWINFFAVICLFGMDDYFIAVFPTYSSHDNFYRNVTAILRWAIKVFLLVFLVTAATVLLLFQQGFFSSAFVDNQHLFLLILFEITLVLLLVSFLRGINKVELSQLIDKIIRPAVFVIGLGLLFLFPFSFSLENVLIAQVICLAMIIIILIWMIRPVYSKTGNPLPFDRSGKSNFTFLSISVLYLLCTRIDILYLSSQVSPELVGYYNIASRLSDFLAYPLMALNFIFPTYLSRELQINKNNLSKTVKKAMKVSVGIVCLLLILAIVFGNVILSLFGENFVHSFWPLILLGSAQLFAACSAPLNAILMVSGRQKYSLMSLAVYVLTTFLCCLILVPHYGLVGAATSIVAGNMMYFITLFYIFKSKNIIVNNSY